MNQIEAGPAEEPFRRSLILAVLVVGAFAAFLSQTMLNVALPQMMVDMGIGANTAQWVQTAYMLVNGVLVPISAYLIQRFGSRALFLVSIWLFLAGSALCAVSPNFGVLLAGRVVQAAGAGILMPLMTVVILNIYPVEQRGRAMGFMGMSMIFAPALGPTLSGWIVEHYSWRVLFYIIIPVTIFSLAIGYKYMKNVTKTSPQHLDVFSAALSTLGFGGILYGFSAAGSGGWDQTDVIASLAVGAAALLWFVLRELKAEKPLLEFRVFRYGMFTLTTLINVIVTMAMFSGMILMPIYLQSLRGFSPVEAGLLMLPGALVMGIMSPVTGALFDRIGARWLAVVGLAVTTATTYLFSTLTLETSYGFVLTLFTLRMFGMSFMMMPIQTAGLNQLPRRLNAHGSAMSQTMRNMAGALGTALLVTVMTNEASSYGAKLAAERGVGPQDAAAMAQLTAEAAVHGINYSFVVATWMTLAALALAFFIRKVRPQEDAPASPVQARDAETGAEPGAAARAADR